MKKKQKSLTKKDSPASLAGTAGSAHGATPRTEREDKIARHYCDVSWQERYELMYEHAKEIEADNRFLAEMMLIKFGPTNYCLTLVEARQLKDCYARAFYSPNIAGQRRPAPDSSST